ncbi:hypothetical protein Ciccas_010609 [Cichlidogyrus casuarinus]|uniref:DUF7041 domain-containing protein n=1 Tax=Cichlidogyrus casuarinus TaxID=1844966 RepID=A0ABD2PUT7_9PLAT
MSGDKKTHPKKENRPLFTVPSVSSVPSISSVPSVSSVPPEPMDVRAETMTRIEEEMMAMPSTSRYVPANLRNPFTPNIVPPVSQTNSLVPPIRPIEEPSHQIATRTQMSVPQFRGVHPSIFFIRLEHFFEISRITDGPTRFGTLLNALSDEQLLQVNPGREAALLSKNPYEAFRTYILEYYQESNAECADSLAQFQWNEREAYRPQVQRMRALADNVPPDYALRERALLQKVSEAAARRLDTFVNDPYCIAATI